MPRAYIIDNPQPNAFATGRNPENAAVAVTTGLLNRLTPEEAAGVIAHELAHIRNRDTLIMTVTATLAGRNIDAWQFRLLFRGNSDRDRPFGMIGTLFAVLVAPIAAMIVQTAISRTREYSATGWAPRLSATPLWFASALRKIAAASGKIVNQPAERFPASAHMFIINPLAGFRMDGLFSTHPPVDLRIAELEAMAAEMGSQPVEDNEGQTVQQVQEETPINSGPWGRNAAPRRGPWS